MSDATTPSPALPGVRSSTIVASVVGAMLLGAVILFATGLSATSAAHHAAHDMRHANAFPCH